MLNRVWACGLLTDSGQVPVVGAYEHGSELCSSLHQIACFKVTEKSYNVARRTAEPRRVRQLNSWRSKASNAVLRTFSRSSNGGESFRGLVACSLVTATLVLHKRRDIPWPAKQLSGFIELIELPVNDGQLRILLAHVCNFFYLRYDKHFFVHIKPWYSIASAINPF
jgi:hypothetical protein